ncbi:hypothetical protein BH20VER1_BH20VER1_03020 [soil metagenome]
MLHLLHLGTVKSLLLFLLAVCTTNAAEFSGIAPGATARANVPLNTIQQRYVAEGGNPVPPHAVAVLAVPPGFSPDKSFPILVALSPSDFKRQNRDDREQFYRQSAFAEGWALLAGDGPQPARHDTAGWRAGITLAALDALHRGFPASRKWPVASFRGS